MRVFIAFDGSCEPFDISPDQTVGSVKLMVKDYFHVQLSDDKQVRHFLELSYAGAILLDSWVLTDVGITPSSVICCLLKQEPVVRVFSAVTGETLSVLGTVFLLSTSVARLMTLVSQQCGLPVSSFRLSSPTGLQLYDCNRLHDYAIDLGATLRLDTWDGWAELLRGCFLGHRLTVQRHLSRKRPVMRFQLRVALYIAASLGHLDLAGWLLERGVRAIEPVGVHPYREWCHQMAHPDAAKCPAVASIERGQLTILKLFIASSVLTLACRDPQGRDPLRIALQHGHRECVRHLATKLCSVVVLPGMALPMRTYVQIKRWVRLGQRRAASRHCIGLNRAPFRTRVGDTVLVDGFTLPKMSSKPRRSEAKAGFRVTSKASQPLTPINCPSHVSCMLRALSSQHAPLQLPKLHPVATRDEREKKRGKKRGCGGKGCEEDESGDQNSNQWRSRVPLPPISRDTNLRPVFASASPNSAQILTTSLESFSLHCNRTPRENAIYCLALASAFTQRPWLQQLNVARTLARRSAQHIG
ncbi:protein ANKUB1-like [Salvelinus fontinalis]|uniref:protein ANKUB1-like n=1 Tax=Salvelinus fontinalis TaxID=8038 RepID=UPI0024861831|nr:protein ANKUB1-like [Salvelinus fontinalis]